MKQVPRPGGERIEREARLRWVPLRQMKVNPLAQRDLRRHRVAELASRFDPEQMGAPTVSMRGGWYYIVDGQHRIEALKAWLGSWDGQQVQCWCYEGLDETAEADLFLRLNDVLAVSAYARYKVAVQAGRSGEADIDRIVRAVGLRISQAKGGGAISAVATLRRVYERAGPGTLSRSLRIIRDAYGDAGLESAVIEGIGLLCQRYNGELPDQQAVTRLAGARGGVHGLTSRAGQLRQMTGSPPAECVAAAAVELINRGSGGRKLPAWWRAQS